MGIEKESRGFCYINHICPKIVNTVESPTLWDVNNILKKRTLWHREMKYFALMSSKAASELVLKPAFSLSDYTVLPVHTSCLFCLQASLWCMALTLGSLSTFPRLHSSTSEIQIPGLCYPDSILLPPQQKLYIRWPSNLILKPVLWACLVMEGRALFFKAY